VETELRALIVDDEPLARQRIVGLLEADPSVTVLGEAGDGAAALRALDRLNPNLVFLDVSMPELSGFEVISAHGIERMPAVVMVTAYSQHAVQAFDVQVVDYLLKPYDKERFQRAVERARAWIDAQHRRSLPPSEMSDLDGSSKRDRLLVRRGETQVLVRTVEIQWLEAEDNYVRVHAAGTSYLLRQTLSGMLARLPSACFRRIHRSYAVNLDYVQHLEPWVHGDMIVVMSDGSRLNLSRTHRHCLRDFS